VCIDEVVLKEINMIDLEQTIALQMITGYACEVIDIDLIEWLKEDVYLDNGIYKCHTSALLSKQWKDSNETDYSIYAGLNYLKELLYCWHFYSGPSAARLLTHLQLTNCPIGKTIDYQGGFGATWILAMMAFEDAQHLLVAGSQEHQAIADKLFNVMNFEKQQHFAFGKTLLFAQETFEHFIDPVSELKKVLNTYQPDLYFDGSSFELLSPAGHFVHNKDVRPEFNATLEKLGYKKIWVDTDFCGGKKKHELCPSLWSRD
jgi:hypothetical protein